MVDNTKFIELEEHLFQQRSLLKDATRNLSIIELTGQRIRTLKESIAKEVFNLKHTIRHRFSIKETR